jgi:hypothetical protein
MCRNAGPAREPLTTLSSSLLIIKIVVASIAVIALRRDRVFRAAQRAKAGDRIGRTPVLLSQEKLPTCPACYCFELYMGELSSPTAVS